MKTPISPIVWVLVSLVFLSACSMSTQTNIPTTSTSSTTSSQQTSASWWWNWQGQGNWLGQRKGRHESVTPTVNSISSWITQVNQDGTKTITKTVSYITPAGTITTDFSLVTSADGLIQSVQATYNGNDHEDAMYHSRFNSSTSSIVGKSISNLSLSAVGGASLTTDAFNKFILSLEK